MRKAFLILTGLIVVGCTTTPVATPPEPTVAIKPIQEVVEPEQKTSIFYHYVDPINQAQPMAVVSGTFDWKNDCLYLILGDGEYTTPLFPELPKGLVKWDEVNKTLNLDGHTFGMGDYINTNGGYLPYHPGSVGHAEYENQGDKKCLMPTLVMVGTMSIEKNNYSRFAYPKNLN